VTGKTSSGTGNAKHLFLVYVNELGHSLGLLHSCINKIHVMTSFFKHGFSTENKYEILSQSELNQFEKCMAN